MTLWQAVIYGLVEGFTEFLPVSSTAHLILLSNLFKLPQNEFVSFFEVFIQAGAILAVIFLYFDYVRKHREVIVPVIASFIPTALVGFFAHDIIKTVFFESNTLIASSLIVVGTLFLVIEYLITKKTLILVNKLSNLTIKEAVVVGFFQSFAIIPGVSRAGAVIVSMLLLKYKRTDAAIYSFLLAVPTILAASALDLIKTDFSVLNGYNILLMAIGFIISFISALVFVRWLIQYLQKNTLTLFGVYRILLGAILLLIFFHM